MSHDSIQSLPSPALLPMPGTQAQELLFDSRQSLHDAFIAQSVVPPVSSATAIVVPVAIMMNDGAGLFVGLSLGAGDGKKLPLGDSLGDPEGASLGPADGDPHGEALGEADGFPLGLADGDALGDSMGEADGGLVSHSNKFASPAN